MHDANEIIAGNTYDKYAARNPLARRMMRGFLRAFDDLVGSCPCESVTEIGCGEGHLARRLARQGLRVTATDISLPILEEARQLTTDATLPIEYAVKDVLSDDLTDVAAELIVCCEVLEHLRDPEAALERLVALQPRFLLLSVPREPIWRLLNVLRGKYVTRLGNTPGHLQHWSTRSFRRLVSSNAEIVVERRPFPWTMLLASPFSRTQP